MTADIIAFPSLIVLTYGIHRFVYDEAGQCLGDHVRKISNGRPTIEPWRTAYQIARDGMAAEHHADAISDEIEKLDFGPLSVDVVTYQKRGRQHVFWCTAKGEDWHLSPYEHGRWSACEIPACDRVSDAWHWPPCPYRGGSQDAADWWRGFRHALAEMRDDG